MTRRLTATGIVAELRGVLGTADDQEIVGAVKTLKASRSEDEATGILREGVGSLTAEVERLRAANGELEKSNIALTAEVVTLREKGPAVN